MAYHIEKTFSNGYRCSCCQRTWETSDWIQDRQEALMQVPKTAYRSENGGDVELLEISVRDGESGDMVASGSLIWCGGRSVRYHTQRWSGFIDDNSFEELRGGQPGETWQQIVAREEKTVLEQKLKAAEEKAKVAEKEAEFLRSQLTKPNGT